MPNIIVEFIDKDGKPNKVGFPGHWSDEQIAAAMERHLSPPKPPEYMEEPIPEARADFFTSRTMSPARARSGLGPARKHNIIRRAPR